MFRNKEDAQKELKFIMEKKVEKLEKRLAESKKFRDRVSPVEEKETE